MTYYNGMTLDEIAGEHAEEQLLCSVCGEFMDASEFEISDEVCKWCDVTIREEIEQE